jgi:hypothetical protein
MFFVSFGGVFSKEPLHPRGEFAKKVAGSICAQLYREMCSRGCQKFVS